MEKDRCKKCKSCPREVENGICGSCQADIDNAKLTHSTNSLGKLTPIMEEANEALEKATKDVELERILEEFDKLVIELNANYGTDNYREFITQAYNLGKEEERDRIKKLVEVMKIDEAFNSSWHKENAKGYNQALTDILNSIGENKGEV